MAKELADSTCSKLVEVRFCDKVALISEPVVEFVKVFSSVKAELCKPIDLFTHEVDPGIWPDCVYVTARELVCSTCPELLKGKSDDEFESNSGAVLEFVISLEDVEFDAEISPFIKAAVVHVKFDECNGFELCPSALADDRRFCP